jgi:hypothetical protein
MRGPDWKNTVLKTCGFFLGKRRRSSSGSTAGVAMAGGTTGWPRFCASRIGRPRSPGNAGPRTGPV